MTSLSLWYFLVIIGAIAVIIIRPIFQWLLS